MDVLAVAGLVGTLIAVLVGVTQLFEFIQKQREKKPPQSHTQSPAQPPVTVTVQKALSTNLPAETTPLIGREEEVAAIQALLQQAEVRLVTLVGPPGTGKTRLALGAAATQVTQFQEGVFLVELAPIRDATLVEPTIAQTLGLKEVANQPLLETLKQYLSDKQMLLVLDNYEQVMPAASLISQLLAAAPRLKALVTSREALSISGEYEFAVSPLPLPDFRHPRTPDSLIRVPSVVLFVQRARAVKPDFQITSENAPYVAELCRALDGLPLAIELAAARSKLLSPKEMLARLESRFTWLTSGARDLPSHQQTLQSTLEWSYQLLDEAEQTLFRRLGVFMGGCSLEAIEAVCNGTSRGALESTASLVDKSLLQRKEGPAGEARLMMLETVREYAHDQLDASGESENLSHQHARYYLALAEQASSQFLGPEQAMWLTRLETDHDNLRAALKWYAAVPDRVERGLQLAVALGTFWCIRGHLSEGQLWLDTFMQEIGADHAQEFQVNALSHLGRIALLQSRPAASRTYNERSLALARELEYDEGIETAMIGLGVALWELGEYQAARKQLEEAVDYIRHAQHMGALARALNNLGLVCMYQGDTEAARAYFDECLAINKQMGMTIGASTALFNLGVMAYDSTDYTRARTLFQEAMQLDQDLGNRTAIADILTYLADIAVDQGDFTAALQDYDKARRLYMELGTIGDTAYVSAHQAELAFYTQEYAEARRLNQEALALFREAGNQRMIAFALRHQGRLACREGDLATAATLCAEALTIHRTMGYKAGIVGSLDKGYIELALAVGKPDVATRLLGAVAAARKSLSIPRSPIETRQMEPFITSMREQLKGAAYTAAFAEGEAMTVEEAAAYALHNLS
jgi:predicted ATPase